MVDNLGDTFLLGWWGAAGFVTVIVIVWYVTVFVGGIRTRDLWVWIVDMLWRSHVTTVLGKVPGQTLSTTQWLSYPSDFVVVHTGIWLEPAIPCAVVSVGGAVWVLLVETTIPGAQSE